MIILRNILFNILFVVIIANYTVNTIGVDDGILFFVGIAGLYLTNKLLKKK